jgi:hypothetical protein
LTSVEFEQIHRDEFAGQDSDHQSPVENRLTLGLLTTIHAIDGDGMHVAEAGLAAPQGSCPR